MTLIARIFADKDGRLFFNDCRKEFVVIVIYADYLSVKIRVISVINGRVLSFFFVRIEEVLIFNY